MGRLQLTLSLPMDLAGAVALLLLLLLHQDGFFMVKRRRTREVGGRGAGSAVCLIETCEVVDPVLLLQGAVTAGTRRREIGGSRRGGHAPDVFLRIFLVEMACDLEGNALRAVVMQCGSLPALNTRHLVSVGRGSCDDVPARLGLGGMNANRRALSESGLLGAHGLTKFGDSDGLSAFRSVLRRNSGSGNRLLTNIHSDSLLNGRGLLLGGTRAARSHVLVGRVGFLSHPVEGRHGILEVNAHDAISTGVVRRIDQDAEKAAEDAHFPCNSHVSTLVDQI